MKEGSSATFLSDSGQWEHATFSLDDESSSDNSCNVHCPACGQLQGALLCRQCSPRPDCFLQFYRTSYLYRLFDAALRFVQILGHPFMKCRKRSSLSVATTKEPALVTADSKMLPKGIGASMRRNCRGGLATRRRQRRQNSKMEGLPVQQQLHRLKGNLYWKDTQPRQKPPNSSNICNPFWATVNCLDDWMVAIASQHQQLIWVVWGLLGVGFFCCFNCFVWPALSLLFVFRRIRILAWKAAVRHLSSNVFSDDLEAQLTTQRTDLGASSGTTPGLRRSAAFAEILSLMESQEKLFFSMPWMAVTAFSYCESLTLAELSTAVTNNLLKHREDVIGSRSCSGDVDAMEEMPLSLFAHPRLLARVQRVMGRYCWVRQQGFLVSQQVMKMTKKGIDLLQQQNCREQLESKVARSADVATLVTSPKGEAACSCTSAVECNCLMDESDVILLVNEALAQPLDPQKPLWQLLLLENVILPTTKRDTEGSSGKQRVGSAVIFRMHHAVGDGVSITRMFLKDFLAATPAAASISTSHTSNLNRQTYPAEAPVCLSTQEAKMNYANEMLFHSKNPHVCGEESEEAESSVPTNCDGGSPLSVASTSTAWTLYGSSMKASTEGSDASEKMQESPHEEAAIPIPPQVLSPLKPSVSVCKVPDAIWWRVLVAIRFALQIPFHAAAMVLLLSYDGLLETVRGGSAFRTNVARPICIPLQHIKDLKERLSAALTQQDSDKYNLKAKHKLKLPFLWSQMPKEVRQCQKQWQGGTYSEGGNIASTAPSSRSSSNVEDCTKEDTKPNNALRITVTDVFASCIVGGYHQYAALVKQRLASSERIMNGSSKQQESSSCKEEIAFIVPVNLRQRDQEAIDLRNRFASLVIQMPVNPEGNSFDRMLGVHMAMRRTVHSFALPMTMCLERWLYATWPDLLMVLFLRLTRKISVIFSSVIGPASLPYIHCSRVHDMHFLVPQPGEVGVGVSAFSCGGNVSICLAADEMVVKNPEMLRACIIAEYHSLCRSCNLDPLKI